MSWWTEERIARLTELWDTVLSASQIANILGATSKNAIISKAHRLKLPERAPRGLPRSKKLADLKPPAEVMRPVKHLPPQPKPEPFKPVIAETALPSRDMELTALTDDDCHYPTVSQGRHHLFCGNPAKPHSSYCPAHHLIACPPAIQPKPRQRRAYAVGRFEMAEVWR